jgi:putative nucleotidyltransferase with HDIG domain
MESINAKMRLFDLVMSLSTATDLVSPAIANHGKRVAYIAMCLAAEAGLSLQEQHDLVLAGALHDIGALSLKERMDLLEFEAQEVGDHAELGFLFLSRSKFLAGIELAVRYHHQHWDGGAGAIVDGEAVPLASHYLHLADRIDVAVLRHVHPLSQVKLVIRKIQSQSGSMFVPELVDLFLRVGERESFWLDLVSPTIDRVLEKKMAAADFELDQDALTDLAKLFSHIIDFKSPFTSTHSAGVAVVAEALARLAGFSQNDCRQMRIAGYLHDIGKLSIPAEILEKAATLSTEEYDKIRSHTYYTRRILESIPAFETITEWASSHHERLDGQGYPFHQGGQELSLGSRIVAVADVFSALTEDRPYRGGLSRRDVLEVMDPMAIAGKLDTTVVELLRIYYDDVNAQRISAQEQAAAEYVSIVEMLKRKHDQSLAHTPEP